MARRKPTKAKGKGRVNPGPLPVRPVLNVTGGYKFRDAKTGRFIRRPKEAPDAPAVKERGIVSVYYGKQHHYRDKATGRFMARPKVAPREIVIGRGKRAKTLRPSTTVEAVKPLQADEADVLQVSAHDISRLVEESGASGRGIYIRHGGVYSRVPAEQAGAFAQLLRLLNSDYLRSLAPLLASPWLRFDVNEFSDRDLFDLDAYDLHREGSPPRPGAKGDIDEAAATFTKQMDERLSEFLNRVKPKRKNKVKPKRKK